MSQDHPISSHPEPDQKPKPRRDLMEIGWREWLSMPDLGIPGVKVKVDTGARSSALHTHDYEVFTEDGIEKVRFHLHPLRMREDVELSCVGVVKSYREVKDSGGHPEQRPFIRTRLKLGPVEWEADVSLTNRESMKFRMLLGRAALARRFTVNPARSYLLGKSLKNLYPEVE